MMSRRFSARTVVHFIPCFLAILKLTGAFDINDPKTNIDSLIRVIGSENPEDVGILYANGTIYSRQPFQELQKLFYFEGFNIGRKEPTGNGYLSLTREVFIYRDLDTSQIVNIWTNAFSGEYNEVFQVHNDPVDLNFTYGAVFVPVVRYPESGVAFSTDILLQYPNVLDPAHYGSFSSGPIYQADELFQYYSDYDVLATTNISSVNMTGSWFRRGQFLPWMAMGNTTGHLYYMTTNWKCLRGFKDFSPDFLQLIRRRFPNFLKPPDKFNPIPQTTWDVIKKEIDRRRSRGLPDVILPTVNISKHAAAHSNDLDPRIRDEFARNQIEVYFNGSVYSEITGQVSLELFQVTGNISVTTRRSNSKSYVFNIKGFGVYRDPKSHQVITSFVNPITNKTLNVPAISFDQDLSVQKDDIFSLPVPNLDKVSVQGLHSFTTILSNGVENWSVDMMNIFFKNADLDSDYPYFYGTAARFGSWFDWLDMGDIEGSLIQRMSVHRVMSPVTHLPLGK